MRQRYRMIPPREVARATGGKATETGIPVGHT